MSNIIQKFLLAGDQKKNTKTQIEDLKFIYINERDKLCFQHDVVYKHFKDIPRRNMSEKGLCDRAFSIASKQNYDETQSKLASMV